MRLLTEEEKAAFKEESRKIDEEISREEAHGILGFMAMFLTSALLVGFLLFIFKAVMA